MLTESKLLLRKQNKRIIDYSSNLLKSEPEEGNCKVLIENAVKERASTVCTLQDSSSKMKFRIGKVLQDNINNINNINSNSNVHKFTKFPKKVNNKTHSKFVLKGLQYKEILLGRGIAKLNNETQPASTAVEEKIKIINYEGATSAR